MPHCNTVLSQMLKMVPRHEFERLANQVDGTIALEPIRGISRGATQWPPKFT